MKDHKVLYSSPRFDVVDVDGMIGLKSKSMSVAIMPYTVDENGLIVSAGFLQEYNPFRPNNYAMTLITGTIEDADQDIVSAAIRELEEEGGISCPRDQMGRWVYLGNFFPYKDSDLMVPTLAVDVSQLELKEPLGDGSEKEKLSTFRMIPINNALASDDLLPLAAFLRLFNYFYSRTVQNLEEPQVQ